MFGPVHPGYWIDIGTPEKYLQVHRDILGGRFRVALEAEARGGGFVARGARIAEGAGLEAPFFVGPGCEIDAGAAIGPDAVLVADVRARAGSRVRDSVLWKGAEAGREATIDGSLLGAGVRIGAHAVVRGAQLGEGSVRERPFEERRRRCVTAIAPGIFKAYDIRGLYPGELDAEVYRRIGRAFVDYLGASKIAVGRDCRLSSPELAAALVAGARAQGASVTDIGVVSTDMLYYYVARHDLEGGAIVTASHNPKEWNGAKLVRRGALALSGDAGIKEIREWLVAGRYAEPTPPPRGELATAAVTEEYARHCLSFVELSRIPRLKVVLDTANGMGAVGVQAIYGSLPLQTTRLYFELDGTFPNHPADPLLEENRRDLVERVRSEGADLGIAWDGDADRCFFVDDQGEYVPGDFVTAVLGEAFARREPGARIVYDVRASRAVPDYVSRAGGTPLMNRVGHAFIKKRMRDENAIFGGEVSGHFYFRENWFADNGMIPALLVLERIGQEGRRLSEILAPLRAQYHISGEINSRVADVPRALARLEERYQDGRITKLDGVSVDYDDWHFNVRAVEHRAAAAAQPRGQDPRGHAETARRAAGARPRLAADA